VQRKFATPPYALESAVPLTHILTAAEAQADYMHVTIPPHSKLLVISHKERCTHGLTQ
jgi:hypothetical protein